MIQSKEVVQQRCLLKNLVKDVMHTPFQHKPFLCSLIQTFGFQFQTQFNINTFLFLQLESKINTTKPTHFSLTNLDYSVFLKFSKRKSAF